MPSEGHRQDVGNCPQSRSSRRVDSVGRERRIEEKESVGVIEQERRGEEEGRGKVRVRVRARTQGWLKVSRRTWLS